MVTIKKPHLLLLSIFLSVSLLTLTGCPWGSMRYYPAETTRVLKKDNSVCFSILDSKDYQPVFIAINLRSVPSKERKFIDPPKLRLTDGQLCFPPSYYHFPDTSKEPFIIEFVLQSQDEKNHPRSFVTAIEMINGRAQNVSLTEQEFDQSQSER
ncbi:hypothetical protein MUU48_13800 [Scandinavium sp. H11S7]|uniref:putative T6SS immunity periplasmic lipoprotein n=1 Tax=Scandinavium hiltneri TaxID=2926519 RepID=UPI000D944482|nr:putative T6SS immunity periplasmic lipoprotein [Scandinavium hiltneri]MCS2157978.1 hypothetical protein [Scandinavium hiltneri]